MKLQTSQKRHWLPKIISKLMRNFFNLLYNQFAWSYDIVAAVASMGFWQQWVFSVIEFLPGERILELGHGPGHLQVKLNQNQTKVFGIDPSQQMTRLTSKRLIKSGLSNRICRAQGQALPLTSNSFDHVVATFPSEYIFYPRTIQEIKRVLHPRGVAVILLQAEITGKKIPMRFSEWLFKITGQTQPWDGNWENAITRPFTHEGLMTQTNTIDLGHSMIRVIIAKNSG